MKLSLIFELLLIFVLLAFAASKSLGGKRNGVSKNKGISNRNDDGSTVEDNNLNKYCKCSEAFCNCCRDFSVPLVNLNGPGCATLKYVNGDKMSVSLSFGKKVLTNKTLASRKPKPVCMPLPGGLSKFCGRVYNIARSGEEFRACLSLELQSKSTVEAALRVSCFKFGPRGVSMEAGDPLPLVPQNEKVDEDDDDDDDDDDDFPLGDDDDDTEFDAINDVGGEDYTGFSLLGEDILGDLFGGSSSGNKKSNKHKKKQAPAPSTSTTTRRPRPSRRPSRKPSTRITTVKPPRTTTVKVRPANTRRPTRRPNRRPGRPSRRPTTASTTTTLTTPSTTTTVTSTTASTTVAVSPVTSTTPRTAFLSTASDETFEPVILVTQRTPPKLSATTPKAESNFEDPGLEMSLAHITGQLSVVPTPIVSNDAKDSDLLMTTRQEQTTYEKLETITPKGITVAFHPTTEEVVNDDLVKVVASLDSSSEEDASKQNTASDIMSVDESRAHMYNFEIAPVPNNKKKNNDFSPEDLDVLDLESIGETVGDQIGELGVFDTDDQNKKRQNRNKRPNKVRDGNKGNNDYDILGLEHISESMGAEIGLFGKNKRKNRNKNVKPNNDNKSDEFDYMLDGINEAVGSTLALDRSHNKPRRNRSRQNKMMRGEWSRV